MAVAVEHLVARDDEPLGLVAVRGEAAVVRVGDAPVVCEDVTLTWLGLGLGLGLALGFGFGLALALALGFGVGFGFGFGCGFGFGLGCANLAERDDTLLA